MDYYSCPSCKTANEDYVKYCKRCGTWLLSDAYPARKIVKSSRKAKGWVFSILLITVLGIIGYLSQPNAKEVIFPKIAIGDDYTLSQLKVMKSSVIADFTTRIDIEYPIDIVVVFYDSDEVRLGRAVAQVRHMIASDQTTTLSFILDENLAIKRITSARIEVVPRTQFDMLN